MKKTIVTLLKFSKLDGEIKVGDEVVLIKELTNEYDNKAIKILSKKGDEIGYVANNEEKSVLEGTFSATKAGDLFKNKTNAIVTEMVSSNAYQVVYKAELILEKEEEKKDEISFLLRGGESMYPSKKALVKDLQTAPRQIKLSMSGDKIVAEYNGFFAGHVANKGETFEILEQYVKDLPQVIANAVDVDKGNIICSLKLKANNTVVASSSINDEIKRIIDEGIDTKENLEEKLDYLRRNKVPDVAILNLLKSYIKYQNEIANRIPKKPNVLYIDTHGIVRKTVQYFNVKKNLQFEGERGVGKNVLAKTLCWLFNRPYYEFSSNSQHSNHALLGSQSFELDKGGSEEKKKGVFGGIMKVLKKFKLVKDDSDVNTLDTLIDAISDKIANSGNSKFIFDKSSIIEACENGGMIVFDEFNTGLAHVMSIFNSLLDFRRTMYVPSYGMVEAHPNFCVISTMNKDYQGTFDTNEATIDRFVPIKFPPAESIGQVIQSHVPDIAYEVLVSVGSIYDGLNSAIKAGSISNKALSIRGFVDACDVLSQGMDLKEALIDNVANKGMDDVEQEVIRDIINISLPD